MKDALFHVFHAMRSGMGRIVLGAALSAGGLASTAQAHHHDKGIRLGDVQLDVDLHTGRAELGRRHWVEPVYQLQTVHVWVEPTYRVIPGERVWVPPVYRNVTDHVWREPVVQQQPVQVWVEAARIERRVGEGRHAHRERVFVPAHYETHMQQIIVAPGHYEDVTRQELVADGHWQTNDRQEVVVPGHYEDQTQRVLVAPGHWEERPLVRVETRIRN